MNGFLKSLVKEMNRSDISDERRAALKAIYDSVPLKKPAILTHEQEQELRTALKEITATLKKPTLSDNARRELIKYYSYVEKMLDPTKESAPRHDTVQ